MVAGMAILPDLEPTAETMLTFIVPAPNGCNLKCPFCFIEQRNEPATHQGLTPTDYVRFIEEIAAKKFVDAVCIQGFEPLLPESFEHTAAILEAAEKHGITSSLITNGTHLAERLADLEKLGVYRIFVSVDSDKPEIHDRMRGVPGAFERTLNGLRQAARSSLNGRVTVVSVLMPKKRDRLLGMPAFLKEQGVFRWIINPLIQVGCDDIGGYKADRSQIFQDALVLDREARNLGIKFILDDEFDRLKPKLCKGEPVDINIRRALNIQRLMKPEGVYRLMPNGQCSVGLQILQEVSSETPRWVPGRTDAFEFVQSLSQHQEAA